MHRFSGVTGGHDAGKAKLGATVVNGEIDAESADGGDKGGGIATGAAGDAIRFIGILKKR